MSLMTMESVVNDRRAVVESRLRTSQRFSEDLRWFLSLSFEQKQMGVKLFRTSLARKIPQKVEEVKISHKERDLVEELCQFLVADAEAAGDNRRAVSFEQLSWFLRLLPEELDWLRGF